MGVGKTKRSEDGNGGGEKTGRAGKTVRAGNGGRVRKAGEVRVGKPGICRANLESGGDIRERVTYQGVGKKMFEVGNFRRWGAGNERAAKEGEAE